MPDDLVLASPAPGKVAARAVETLEQLLEKITPTVDAVSEQMELIRAFLITIGQDR